jgi:hypothetical protein
MGVLVVMPEEMTGWDTEADIFGKWWENVRNGPEWDRNNWIYNYVGHTYSGGVYYQVARKSGYRQWDAFVYTFLMSTFYWEYGVEAFAEEPSIQDLAVTPLMGWVYGEWAYQTEIGIRDNGNRAFGSKILGEISLAVLDPIDAIGRAINRVAGRKWIKAGYGYFSYAAAPTETGTDHTVYLNVSVPLGGQPGPDDRETTPIRLDDSDDPVDTGIVGVSIGPGYTQLDDAWGVDDDLYTKISLGLYLTPYLSSRVTYARAELTEKVSGEPVTFENYSLDAQYYLNTSHPFRPFLTAGFGEQLWDERVESKTFQWNAGLGMHWKLHRKWALQADWISYYSPSRDTYDQAVNAGLVFRFGQGEHDKW